MRLLRRSLRTWAAFQKIKKRFESIGSLKEDLRWKIIEVLVLQFLAWLKDSLMVSELEGHWEVKEMLLISIWEYNEWQLAFLFKDLLLMHDLHVALIDSRLKHHCLNVWRSHLGGHITLAHGLELALICLELRVHRRTLVSDASMRIGLRMHLWWLVQREVAAAEPSNRWLLEARELTSHIFLEPDLSLTFFNNFIRYRKVSLQILSLSLNLRSLNLRNLIEWSCHTQPRTGFSTSTLNQVPHNDFNCLQYLRFILKSLAIHQTIVNFFATTLKY